MAVNNLTYEQSYAFLTDLYEQATGKKSDITVTDTGTFTTVAQVVLKTGYDNIINSISQVLTRTIFSVRPYSAKFKGISVDVRRWGAITRKINYVDTPIEQDDRMSLVDGASVDQWNVRKPVVLQTNFYGATEYQKHITIFKDQLDSAFQNVEAFGSFIGGVIQNISDQLEQIKEEEARGCLINFIAGKYVGDPSNCINVLQAYYDETGVNLTPATMYNSENYVNFTKWLYSFINTLTDKMAERSIKYHINVTGKEIMRHTPAKNLKAYMSASALNRIDSTVLSSVFNPEKLKMIDFEKITYYQNLNHPESIVATPTYLHTDGTLKTAESTTINNIVGVLFDEEALGITTMSTWMQSTPMNARGGYYNIFYHFRQCTWNDFTENGVVLYANNVTP